jgi:hypothetical protein
MLNDIYHLLIFLLIGQGALVILVFFMLLGVGPVSGRLQKAILVLHDIADDLERLRKDLASRKD